MSQVVLANQMLGKTFADTLEAPGLVIGSTTYTKAELVDKLGVGNFTAAARLTTLLKRLKVRTPKQLLNMPPTSLARVIGVGHAQLYVAMCILEHNKLSVERWWGWKKDPVKFSTHKDRALRRAKKRGGHAV